MTSDSAEVDWAGLGAMLQVVTRSPSCVSSSVDKSQSHKRARLNATTHVRALLSHISKHPVG